ncbi:MAG: leucine-rich repeat protein [Clostridia bacterium]|nr:leucine-rich repeat protein [Clostridia bacterium]
MRNRLGKAAVLALALLLALACASALAETERVILTGKCGANLTWEVRKAGEADFTLEIKGNGAMTAGFSFVENGGDDEEDFYFGWSLVRRLILPDGLTSISDRAFYAVLGGADVVIPSGVKTIGEEAFANCWLSSLTLQEGLRSIGSGAFSEGYNAYSTVIPKSVTTVGEDAFDVQLLWVYSGSNGEKYCKNDGIQHYLVIDESDKTRSDALLAFSKAVGAVEDVPVRYRVPAIEAVASLNLTAAQLQSLTAYVRQEETALKDVMNDNAMTADEISGFVTRFKKQMSDIGVTVATKVKLINGYYGVELIATVNGEERRVQIFRTGRPWNSARSERPEVEEGTAEEIVLSSSDVTLSVGESFKIKATLKPAGATATLFWGVYPSTVLRIDEMTDDSVTVTALRPGTAQIEAYTQDDALLWGSCDFTVSEIDKPTKGGGVFPKRLTTIRDEAFAGTKFKQFYIPDGVTTIGSGAFRNCKSLRFIRIPNSVTSIASDAFQGCTNLQVFCDSESYAATRLMGNDNITFIFMYEEDDSD